MAELLAPPEAEPLVLGEPPMLPLVLPLPMVEPLPVAEPLPLIPDDEPEPPAAVFSFGWPLA